MSSSPRSNGKRAAFGSITYRRLQLLGRRRLVSIFLHTHNNIWLRVCTAALMKTWVQLISPVYLRMCSDECCCLAVFILYTFYLSSSLSRTRPLTVFHSAHRRPFFSYLYTENRTTARWPKLDGRRRIRSSLAAAATAFTILLLYNIYILYNVICSRRGGEWRRVRIDIIFFLFASS